MQCHVLCRYCSVEIPPRERSLEEKAEIRSEPLSMEAQSIWHKETDTITEQYVLVNVESTA